MQVVLDHTEAANAAGNAVTFWFKPPHKVDNIAGQYIEIQLPHENADDRGVKRWFTLSSSPTEPLISITTKLDASHPSSFKQTLFSLQPGAEVALSEPMGDFVLPKDTTIPLLFIAGGIGITPMRSMIKYLKDKQEQRQITLLYAAKDSRELVFRDLLESVDWVDLRPIYAEPEPGWEGLSGRLSVGTILEARTNDSGLIYISGPEPMTEQFEKDLKARGIPADQLVLDFFPGYPY